MDSRTATPFDCRTPYRGALLSFLLSLFILAIDCGARYGL